MTENQAEIQTLHLIERKLSFEEVPIELPILGEMKLYHLRLEPEKDVGLAPLVFRGGVATPTHIQKGFLRGLEEGLPNLPIEVFSDPDSWVSLKPTSWRRLVGRKNLEGQGWAFAKTIRQTLPQLQDATFLGFSAGATVGLEAAYRTNLAKPGTFKNVVLVEPAGFTRNSVPNMIGETLKEVKRGLHGAWFEKYPVKEQVRRRYLTGVNAPTFWTALAASSVDYYTPSRLRRIIQRGGFENLIFIVSRDDEVIKGFKTLERLRLTFEGHPKEKVEAPEGRFQAYQVGKTRVVIGEIEGSHSWAILEGERLAKILQALIPDAVEK